MSTSVSPEYTTTMSKLNFTNVSLNQPKISRDVKADDEIFLLELEERKKERTKQFNETYLYRPGKAPVYGAEENEDDADLLARKKKLEAKQQARVEEPREKTDRRRRVEKTFLDKKTRTTRKKFTAEVIEGDEDVEAGGVKKEEQQVIDTSNLEVQELPSESESEDEDVEDRRARARARIKARQAEEEAGKEEADEDGGKKGSGEEDDDDDDEGDSEYETDTEDEDDGDFFNSHRPLLKPVFVSKKERETVEERKRLEAEKEAEYEDQQKRDKERKKESRQLVIQEVKREEEAEVMAQTASDGVEILPNDEDDINEEEELEKWKIRELKRIKRDKEKQEEFEKEEAEKERRRNMTDKELELEALKNPKKHRPRGNMRYLQKYYHRGAYFQDGGEEELFMQDFNEATGEDRTVDRTLLPTVLQVKKFGLKGRTKYTHLVDQDTTATDVNPWGHKAQGSVPNAKRKIAGIAPIYDGKSKKSK